MKETIEHHQSQPFCRPLQPLTPPLRICPWEYLEMNRHQRSGFNESTFRSSTLGPNTLHAVPVGKALQPIADHNSMHLLRGSEGESKAKGDKWQ